MTTTFAPCATPVPATVTPTLRVDVIAQCAAPCGRYLGYSAGQLVHAGTCPTCYDPTTGKAKLFLNGCPNVRAHLSGCLEPDPELCEHQHTAMARVDGHPCARGHEFCCGCCHEDEE